MALVSVIIPYFRKKKYFLKTLNSVINQSFKKIEIILIYDDKNKKDLTYVKKIIKKDKRIKLIVNKTNYGAGISRNIGIKFSKGKYISFLDADDVWLRNKLKIQFNYMKKNNLNFTHTSYKIIDENSNYISQRKARNFMSVNDLIKSCDIGLSTVMIKRKLLNQKSFPKLKTKEDYVLWLKLLSKNVKIYGIKDNLVLWRKVKNSLSSSFFQKMIDGFRVYNTYMRYNFLKSLFFLFFLSFNYLRK